MPMLMLIEDSGIVSERKFNLHSRPDYRWEYGRWSFKGGTVILADKGHSINLLRSICLMKSSEEFLEMAVKSWKRILFSWEPTKFLVDGMKLISRNFILLLPSFTRL